MSRLVLDPGNSTGWVIRKDDGTIIGGTIDMNHLNVAQLIKDAYALYGVTLVVYETFQLYPGKANKMVWNSFYPCEVIGVIKCTIDTINKAAADLGLPVCINIEGLSPSVKKYAGPCKDWNEIRLIHHSVNGFEPEKEEKITEHTRDAYRLLKYYELNYKY